MLYAAYSNRHKYYVTPIGSEMPRSRKLQSGEQEDNRREIGIPTESEE